jgi:hypothetical protein
MGGKAGTQLLPVPLFRTIIRVLEPTMRPCVLLYPSKPTNTIPRNGPTVALPLTRVIQSLNSSDTGWNTSPRPVLHAG